MQSRNNCDFTVVYFSLSTEFRKLLYFEYYLFGNQNQKRSLSEPHSLSNARKNKPFPFSIRSPSNWAYPAWNGTVSYVWRKTESLGGTWDFDYTWGIVIYTGDLLFLWRSSHWSIFLIQFWMKIFYLKIIASSNKLCSSD